MNKIILISFLTLLSINAQSQNIGIGSKWIYEQGWFFPWSNNEVTTTIEIISDTLIDNKQFFILSGNCECSDTEPLILRWENNQILQYIDSKASLLYDFNLNKGDSLSVSFSNYDSIESTLVIIDSTEIINGIKYQHISVSQDDPNHQYTDWYGTFVEDIGSLNWCITPQAPLCENGTGGLCSFITPNQDTIKFHDNYNCIISSTIDINSSALNVKPNPSSTFWIIPNTTIFNKYYLYKITGEEVENHNFENKNEILIDASQLPLGTYVLTLTGTNGKFVTTKLVRK